MSECKIYKVLVDMNEYDNETARDVAKLFHAGKSPTDISRILHKSNTSVSKYLPYTNGVYNAEQPTENAFSRKCYRRNKKKLRKWIEETVHQCPRCYIKDWSDWEKTFKD